MPQIENRISIGNILTIIALAVPAIMAWATLSAQAQQHAIELADHEARLWRNKAYTLRHWMRARITDDMPREQSGESIPKRWGYSSWSGKIGPYWEWQPRLGLGSFHIYLRCGWKLKPFFEGGSGAAGIFTGVSIRSDDWDDYVET